MSTMNLADWHAEPVSAADAEIRLLQIRELIRHSVQSDNFNLRLQEVIARFWLGREIHGDVEQLLAQYQSVVSEAWVHSIYGQLLMSHKLKGAFEQLQLGFNKASNYYSARGYLKVLKRQEILSYIVETESGGAPCSLEMLLAEGNIIKKLMESKGPRLVNNPSKDDISG